MPLVILVYWRLLPHQETSEMRLGILPRWAVWTRMNCRLADHVEGVASRQASTGVKWSVDPVRHQMKETDGMGDEDTLTEQFFRHILEIGDGMTPRL